MQHLIFPSTIYYNKHFYMTQPRIDIKEQIIQEMMVKQLKTIPNERKFIYDDILRIGKNIDKSIFGDECAVWNGYVTNENNTKGTYINFLYNGKKTPLHRLLYVNFMDDIDENHYIRYSCENKGKCCNVTHMIRCDYKKKKPVKNDNANNKEEIVKNKLKIEI